jgi:uncharacterized protein
MTDNSNTEVEAAAWRSLVNHLQQRSDVQNIDLMNLSGFCRNCLYKWMLAAADDQGVELAKDDAIHAVYGMPVAQWKENHQAPATDEQKRLFQETKPLHSEISGHR